MESSRSLCSAIFGIAARRSHSAAPDHGALPLHPTLRLNLWGRSQHLHNSVQSGISLGTERMWFDGSASALRSGRRSYPYRPGYALVGRVALAGSEFSGTSIGSRVFAMKPHGSHAVLTASDLWLPLPDRLDDDDALSLIHI